MLLYVWMMVQVIGECLPISSSGHVMLLQKLYEKIFFVQHVFSYENALSYSSLSNYDVAAFDYSIQGISALVIFVYFFGVWWQLIIQKPCKLSYLFDKNVWIKVIPHVFLYGFVADGITFLLWMFDIAFYIHLPLSIGFFITACSLWSLQFVQEKKEIAIWSYQYAFLVGLVQGCALLSGISRFATTLTILSWLGYKQSTAFAVSFLLQVPLLAAGSIRGFLSLSNTAVLDCMQTYSFMISTIFVAFIAYRVLEYVGQLIEKKLVWKISYYMIIPTVIALLV